MAMTSQSVRLRKRTARAMEAGAAAPCTGTFTSDTWKPNPDSVMRPMKSR